MRNKGITLVALVITIIILLILAAVAISLTIGQNGIIDMAKQAGRNYQNAQMAEGESLNELGKQIANYDNSFNITGTEMNGEIPEGYIKPEGTKLITSNGEHDVTEYEKVNVDVPTYEKDSTIPITTKNNKIDVSNYQYADTTGLYTKEEVQSGEGVYWHKTTQTFPATGNTMTINLGYTPTFLFVTAKSNANITYRWWSLDSGRFIECATSDGRVFVQNSGIEVVNDKIVITAPDSNNFRGVVFHIYTMK